MLEQLIALAQEFLSQPEYVRNDFGTVVSYLVKASIIGEESTKIEKKPEIKRVDIVADGLDGCN